MLFSETLACKVIKLRNVDYDPPQEIVRNEAIPFNLPIDLRNDGFNFKQAALQTLRWCSKLKLALFVNEY